MNREKERRQGIMNWIVSAIVIPMRIGIVNSESRGVAQSG